MTTTTDRQMAAYKVYDELRGAIGKAYVEVMAAAYKAYNGIRADA